MQVVVVADGSGQAEFRNKECGDEVNVQYVLSLKEVSYTPGVLFYLLSEEELVADLETLKDFNCPIFVHAVINTLGNLPAGVARINAWPGFLTRETVEIVAADAEPVKAILEQLGWSYRLVADVPGMIAARMIAMIINEAYFALGDDVSSKQHIDTAMKLGTKYPFGPFEWSEKIGLENILQLLMQLSINDKRYTPAPLLIKELSS